MDSEAITSNIIVLLCNFLCSVTFISISIWAAIRKEPMHFYSGTTIDPRTIADIPAYNKANAKMWFKFSILFVLSFLCNIVAFFLPSIFILSVVLIVFGCTVGIIWLVLEYQKIASKFIIR